MKTFTLTIAKVDGPVFAGAVTSLIVPGAAGDMTILPEHAPLISPLRPGTLVYTESDGTKHELPVAAGTLEVAANQATVLL